MKITSVEVYRFEYETAIMPNGKRFKDRPIVCKVNTDKGLYGNREAGVSYGDASQASVGMIKDLAGLVIGNDPLNNEAKWEKCSKNPIRAGWRHSRISRYERYRYCSLI